MSIQRMNPHHTITAPLGMMRCEEDGQYVSYDDHIAEVARAEQRYQRPFSEEEAKAVDAHASYADVGLANAMLLRRIGWKKWTKESVERTKVADAARAGKEPKNGY